MRSASSGFKAALTNIPTTLCRLWKITRQDGRVFRFTDHDADVLIPSDGVYLCAYSFQASAVFTSATQANAQSTTITANTNDAAITENDVRQRLFDGALHQLMYADYTAPSDGVLNIFRGITGQIKMYDKKRVDIEVVPIGTALGAAIAHESYSLTCRNALGDFNCSGRADNTVGFDINSTKTDFTVVGVLPHLAEGFASDKFMATGLATDFFDGDTITIGARVYTFKSTMPTIPSNSPANSSFIHITGTLSSTLLNFMHCINNSGGTPGTDYANSNPTFNFADELVSALASNNTITITARQVGASPNGFGVSYAPTNVAVGGWQYAFLTGGFAGTTLTATQLTQAENFYATGFVQWTKGGNKGTVSFIQASSFSLHSVTLSSPPLLQILPGDQGTVFQGCDKQVTTCKTKFNNVVQFRGEPFVPTQLLLPKQVIAQIFETRLA